MVVNLILMKANWWVQGMISSTSIEIYENFGSTIDAFRSRHNKITEEIWNYQLENEWIESEDGKTFLDIDLSSIVHGKTFHIFQIYYKSNLLRIPESVNAIELADL
jgi:hypothetical protein